jgi:two-component system CheB/CheR fusion protein
VTTAETAPQGAPSPVDPHGVVVVGTADGGLAPLRQLLHGIPPSARVSVVVLSPRMPIRPDDLSGIGLSVGMAVNGSRLEPGHVYVVASDCEAEIKNERLALAPLTDDIAPIDRAFKSASTAYGVACAGVVLSGHGADGALGLRRIKESGGLTVSQDPSEASVEAMPRSAIATGLVDLVLPAAAIGPRVALVAEPPTSILAGDDDAVDRASDPLREILTLVRVRSGHDFANYKRATLLRRVSRRMQVSQVDSLGAYLRHLREDPNELSGLLRDFMISVTNFFRDPEVFVALDRMVLARMFIRADPGAQIRIWVAGCATGEEAYSLAILCAEQSARMTQAPSVQIFATDIDQDALNWARAGRYPSTIRADVSEERLARFFTEEADGAYRVRKEIRELVLFSPHNVLRDPPFSKLDLVTCRNLLIYLNREAQERVLAIVHFGLKPEGHLLLGSSETAETSSLLFNPVDVKHRIFMRRTFSPSVVFATSFPQATWPSAPQPTPSAGTDRATSFGDIHHRLVEQYAAPSVLVNENLDVVHVSERAGRYLSMVGGEPSRNLLRLIHESLRLDVRAVIYGARQAPGTSHRRTVQVTLEGALVVVTVVARSVDLPGPTRRMLLVMFEESAATDDTARQLSDRAEDGAIEPVVRQLEDELQRARDQLRTTIEQYETSVEELKASNEELHAINEELRSATEELETGKEELQSVNEELTTVNCELKDKIEELSRANSDLSNLMASTEIGVIFLDRSLRIKRYTPRAQDVFNLIPSDVGRPLAHITHSLEGVDLTENAATVLGDLRTLEREVRSKDGRHYLARLHPYRSLDDRIDGVVVTLLHVTELKHAEEALRGRDRMLRLAERAAEAGFWECDRTTRRFRVTDEYQALFGVHGEGVELTLDEWLTHVDPADRERAGAAIERAFVGEELDLRIRALDPKRGIRWLWHTGRIESDGDATPRVSGIAIDVTSRRSTEVALLQSEQRFRSALRTAPVVILNQDRNLRYTWGYGFGAEMEVVGKTDADLFPSDEAEVFQGIKSSVMASGVGRSGELGLTFRGTKRIYEVSAEPIREESLVIGITCTAVDVTASRTAELALRDADRRKDEFLATLAHELRNPLAPIRAALDIQKLAGNDLELIARTRDKMDRQLVQIVRLVDDLMDVGRITSGRIQLRLEVFPIASAVDAAIESTRPLFESLDRHLTVHVRNNDVLLHADFARVTQVVTNLLQNAAKYTRTGGQVELEVRAHPKIGRVDIRVSDDGVGIDADMLPRVFDMFAQSTATLDRAHGGLGIGLSLVKKLVELHGGSVAARSDGKGKGAEFVVSFPWTGRMRAPEAGGGRDVVFESKRVLIVDDNPDVTDMMAEVLRLVGHETSRAHDGATAVRLVEATSPDIVILDIGLPDMDGYETGRRIRATTRGAEIVLIAMTGWEGAVGADDGAERVFDHYLTKPADLGELRRLVQMARPKRTTMPPPAA